MTVVEIFLTICVLIVSTRMLPRGAGVRHYFLPLLFAGSSFLSMRQARVDPSLSWADACVVFSFIVGFYVKGVVEDSTSEEES